MSLASRIQELLGITSDDLFDQDEEVMQQRLAVVLRKTAIEHLRRGRGVVAEGFRAEYYAVNSGHYADFLDKQKNNGVWGTYLEATALAEKLGCHLVVTPVKTTSEGQLEQKPICLYRATVNTAPTIHLHNIDNVHWYIKRDASHPHVKSATGGGGNCLYCSISQSLKQRIKEEEIRSGKTITRAITPSQFFNNDIVHHQQEIASAIQKQPTPAELHTLLEKERERIARLSPDEQEQIRSDHQLALKLARDEMRSVSTFSR